MLTDSLLTDGLRLRVDGVEMEGETVVVSVTSTNQKGICPHCKTISERIHSYYGREPADLPLAGCAVRLDMTIPRFFCDNQSCESRTFAERMSDFIQPYAHCTDRLASQQEQVAFALGGEPGSRLLAKLGMAVSPDTLLRSIRNAPEPEVTAPRVLGLDEWAKRKGHSYGTIIVDLETQQPVDLLPEKSTDSFAEWLKAHPGVEIISRDRCSEYIKGATDGAPDAIQVADRWHLLTNLRDTLKRLLEGKRACLKAAGKSKQAQSTDHEGQLDNSPKVGKKEKEKLAKRGKRQERYNAAKDLHKQGFSQTEIAHRLSIARKTVRKYIRADECPIYPEGRTRPSKLDPYKDYVIQRWEAGCHNATQILYEIRRLGFKGSRSIMMDWVSKALRPQVTTSTSSRSERVVPWSAGRASWLLVKKGDELTEEDKQALERMKRADEKVAGAYELGQRFTGMIRERQFDELLPWLEDAKKSGIEALKQFAKGIKQDLTAVTNALSLPWSNGQTEGQVNRLKLIKRQMYGRANFDLLRKRVLAQQMRY